LAINSKYEPLPVKLPVYNINTYIRVPGHEPYPLGRALQEWDGISVREYRQQADGTNSEWRTIREVVFGELFTIPVNEQVYEMALYTLATRRLADWMRDNRDKIQR
jgi:hypothetical protein